MISTIIKLLLFFISTIGYYFFIYKKTKIDKSFLPLITIEIQIFILFFAGLFNILKEISILLYITGIVLCIYYLYINIHKLKRKDMLSLLNENINYIYMLILIILFCFILKGKMFSHYDNFSHWALVVKNMLLNNRYPNFNDKLITFQQYPLGTATYIYYFSKMISSAESIQMLAQNFMNICALFPLTKYIKKKNYYLYLILFLFTNFIFCLCTQLDSLLVDTLLPLFAFGTYLFIYEEIIKKDNKKSAILLIPLLSSLILIKNSAIFFVIFECLQILYKMKKNKKWKDYKYYLIMIFPFATLLLWNKHCEYVFFNANNSKHSMNVDNYSKILNSKTKYDISKIIKDTFNYYIGGKELLILIGFIIFSGILIYILSKKNKNELKKYLKNITILFVIYIIYLIGTIGMYIFSMPLGEALVLAGISRYRATIFIFIYCWIMWLILNTIFKSNLKKKENTIILLILALSIIIINYLNHNKLTTIFDKIVVNEKRMVTKEVIKKNTFDNAKTIFYINKYDNGYTVFLLQYEFNSTINKIILPNEISKINKNKYDYLIILTEKEEKMTQYIMENYPAHINDKFIKLNEVSK